MKENVFPSEYYMPRILVIHSPTEIPSHCQQLNFILIDRLGEGHTESMWWQGQRSLVKRCEREVLFRTGVR